ncbi:IS1 family transposase [Klebsiella pneumoniae]
MYKRQPFDVVIWMTDGWPLYESRLKGKLHVISKRYTCLLYTSR